MIRLAVRVARAQAEVALAQLLELAPAGVEEVDLPSGVVEYAVYGAPGEIPALPDLHAAVGGALVEVRTSEVADDWADRWRAFHRPVLVGDPGVGRALHVRPPWADPRQGDGIEDIVVDPGQAFGTGAHTSTRLCLELMLELHAAALAVGALSDVGCGSGVLAIAACRLGWGPVVASDHDAESVAAATRNARANGTRISVLRCDVRRQEPPSAPTMVANLTRALHLELAETISTPPVRIVAGGLLTGEAGAVRDAFADRLGLRETGRRTRGDWTALLLSARA